MNSSYFNMVEDTEKNSVKTIIESIEKLRITKLKPETLEDDLLVMEMKVEWKAKTEWEKICFAISEADLRIMRWHKEKGFEATTGFAEWASLLKETFGPKKISAGEFSRMRRKKGEVTSSFIKRMLECGKRVRIPEDEKLSIIREAIDENNPVILSLILTSKTLNEELILNIEEMERRIGKSSEDQKTVLQSGKSENTKLTRIFTCFFLRYGWP